VHTCSRTNQSNSCNSKRKGSAELVATFLNEEYPGKLMTPVPRDIIDLIKLRLGVSVSYSTALRGKNLAMRELRGNSEDSYKMLPSYLYMLEQVNSGTTTEVKLDEAGKFKYLFIALGACIEGFKAMRKVILVDATFLKNGYGGVLVFAKAQDPNHHHYPLAFAVLDGENNASWTWFFEMLKTVIPDSSEIVFMSDRNQSLITAVANVYPQSHHGHCIWHLAQNVRNHACNTIKAVVPWRFMELARYYIVPEFEAAYASFKVRYPSACKYLEENTNRATWARVYFPGCRYNLDTSNSVESMNSAFRDARRYALIPLLDTIIKKISDWFNEHRKDAVSGSLDTKLVPLVEIHLHNLWAKAEKTPVRELNSYDLEYEVTDTDNGKVYLVNLIAKSCSCKVFDYEKYPCLHGLAAYLYFLEVPAANGRRREVNIEYHQLCSKYYWTELFGNGLLQDHLFCAGQV